MTCKWLVGSDMVPKSSEGVHLDMEWQTHNGHVSASIHNDTEWSSLMARLRTQAVQKIVVVVSWHTLTPSLVNRFSRKCVLNEDEPVGMQLVGAGIQ